MFFSILRETAGWKNKSGTFSLPSTKVQLDFLETAHCWLSISIIYNNSIIRETAGWKYKSGTFLFFFPKSNLIFLKQHIVNFDSAERNLLVCRKDLSGSMETKFISQFRNLDFYIKTLFLLRIYAVFLFSSYQELLDSIMGIWRLYKALVGCWYSIGGRGVLNTSRGHSSILPPPSRATSSPIFLLLDLWLELTF